MSDDNVPSLAVIRNDKQKDEQRETIHKLEANLPVILLAQRITAQITRHKYESLVAQGFTEQQALELCKS